VEGVGEKGYCRQISENGGGRKEKRHKKTHPHNESEISFPQLERTKERESSRGLRG